MSGALKKRFNIWLFRPKIEHGTVVLTQRRIFILPTKSGFAMAFLLVLMLLGDINYNLNMGYVLTFLLTMMAVMSMLHAFRNLAYLEIRAGRADPVFCGEKALFHFHISNPGKLSRYSLTLEKDAVVFDIFPGTELDIAYPATSTRRGHMKTGRLKLYTEFPLGLFHAWSYLHFDTRCLIYPKPTGASPLPRGDGGKNLVAGDQDFAGLRNYSPGDALPRIAWKAYAQGHALQVKQFSNQTGEELLLDLSAAPGADLEEKLSQLTRWVLDAEAASLQYRLRLPDGETAIGNGTAHRDDCLRRIALFGVEST